MKQILILFVIGVVLQPTSFAADVVESRETRASRHKKKMWVGECVHDSGDSVRRPSPKKPRKKDCDTLPTDALVAAVDGSVDYVADSEVESTSVPAPNKVRAGQFNSSRSQTKSDVKSDPDSLILAISKMYISCEKRASELQEKAQAASDLGSLSMAALHQNASDEAASVAQKYRAAELAIAGGVDPHEAFDLYVIKGKPIKSFSQQARLVEPSTISVPAPAPQSGDVGVHAAVAGGVDEAVVTHSGGDDFYDLSFSVDEEMKLTRFANSFEFSRGFSDGALGIAPQDADNEYLAGYDKGCELLD